MSREKLRRRLLARSPHASSTLLDATIDLLWRRMWRRNRTYASLVEGRRGKGPRSDENASNDRLRGANRDSD